MAERMTEYERLHAAMSICVKIKRPANAIGDPGIGKTQSIYQISTALSKRCFVNIASLRQPEDFLGIPFKEVTKENISVIRYATFEWCTQLSEDDVVFIDEISTCATPIQAALMRMLLEGYVGDFKLPKVSFVTAMNEPEDVGGYNLTLPMRNRLTHFNWVPDEKYLMRKASGDFLKPQRVPDSWQERVGFYEAVIGGFLRKRPELRNKKPSLEEKADKEQAWPSSRSWEAVASLMAASEAADETVQHELIKGTVGLGAATEFIRYAKEADLPDPEDLLRDPSSFKMPDRSDLQYAVLQSIVGAIASKFTQERIVAGWQLLNKAGKDYAIDIAAVAARELVTIQKKNGSKYIPNVDIFEKLSAQLR